MLTVYFSNLLNEFYLANFIPFLYTVLWSWFEVFKETTAGELIEANCHAKLNCLKQLLDDVIFIRFNNKKLSHSYTKNLTE